VVAAVAGLPCIFDLACGVKPRVINIIILALHFRLVAVKRSTKIPLFRRFSAVEKQNYHNWTAMVVLKPSWGVVKA
jgi:hypothetical protein